MRGVLDYMICACKYKMRGILHYMVCTCKCIMRGVLDYEGCIRLYDMCMYSTYQMQLKRQTRFTRSVNACVINSNAFVVEPTRVRS